MDDDEIVIGEIDIHLAVAADWEEARLFVCNVCGTPARLHPQTTQIWGCLTCGFTTAAVSHFFNRRHDAGDSPKGK